MADSNSYLIPDQGDSLAPRSPSLDPSSRPSDDGARSQDRLLYGSLVDNDLRRVPGDSVAHAPPQVQEVQAENAAHATDRLLNSFTPMLLTKEITLLPSSHPSHLDDLDYWPTILKWKATLCLILLYTATGTAISILMWKSIQNPNHNFRLASENVHMISRYFPSIVGTVTVLFFRQTVREALRMVPFVSMADQDGDVNNWSKPAEGVGGAWFPWQSITTTPKSFISIFSLVCQLGASFIVSLKVALFASAPQFDDDVKEPYWILSVRLFPAAVLILGYIVMIVYTLYLSYHFRGQSTGLKWDPVSIADYASLFAHCNALKYFAPLELRHDLRPEHVMVPSRIFRLGYWTRVRDNSAETDVVYGIGVKFDGHADTGHISQKERNNLGRPWQHIITFQKPEKIPPKPVGQCDKLKGCAHGIWPDCEHYPYNYNPGCARWLIALASLLPISALALSIYALVIGLPKKGFSFPNNLKLPSNFHYGFGSENHHLPPVDPADPKSTVLLWALMFRSVPTYVAGLFTSTIITWIDLNMRFMQPFRNMFGKGPERTLWQYTKESITWRRRPDSSADDTRLLEEERIPASATESILLAYITVSPMQVPLTAWNNRHYKVCIYSTLSTLSPLFPIFVGGLLTVTPDENYNRVNFQFSLSAYIGVMVSLVLYSVLLPIAIPKSDGLLPRQLYSLADLMAMCHESKFMASPHLDITHTASKQHMEARLLLSDDHFQFGVYRGRDGQEHIGFDVTRAQDLQSGQLINVKYIPPEGFASRVQGTARRMMEDGRTASRRVNGAMKGNVRSPFRQQTRGIRPGEELEGFEMAGGLGEPSARAEASGFQPR